jgi:hypothetical protein
MEAPRAGLSLAGLNAAVKVHYQQMYRDTNHGQVCKGCGTKVMFTPGTVVVHNTAPGVECPDEESYASEEPLSLPLPYCPQCEGVPMRTSTCVHMGIARPTRLAFGGLSEDTGQLECV